MNWDPALKFQPPPKKKKGIVCGNIYIYICFWKALHAIAANIKGWLTFNVNSNICLSFFYDPWIAGDLIYDIFGRNTLLGFGILSNAQLKDYIT